MHYPNLRLSSNYILIQPDDHFDWLFNSEGKKFLHLNTAPERYQHSITSGTVMAVPEGLSADYPLGTTMELEVGDKVVIHYLAIDRDRDGDKIIHTEINGGYPIKYENIFFRIRNGEVRGVNGWVLIEPEEEVINTILHLPRSLQTKKSQMICRIKYLSTPLTHYGMKGDGEKDSDKWYVGQKVIIPAWRAIELQHPTHQIVHYGSVFYRIQRKDMTDYEWVVQGVRKWRESHPITSPEKTDVSELYRNFDKQVLAAAAPVDGVQIGIVHKQRTKHVRDPKKHYQS